MMKKFINWLNTFLFCKKKIEIPSEFSLTEKIVRIIFSPLMVKNNSVKSNAFRPTNNTDEISVNRLDYTTPDFCKELGKKNENPKYKRKYFGLAVLRVGEIQDCGATIEYSPIFTNLNYNLFHSDIKTGFIQTKGEPMSAEALYIADNLSNQARLYQDKNVASQKWCGDQIM